MLWPFEPRPSIIETIRFGTDVLRSDTAEMRYSLHGPLQSFDMTFALDNPQFQIAQGRILAAPNTGWTLPMWHEQQPVSVAAIDTEITCDVNASFSVGGSVVVWSDWDSYTVAEIDSIGASSITITAAIGTAYSNGILMPIRTVNVRAWDQTRQIKHRTLITATFEATDTPDLAPAGMVSGYTGPDSYPLIGYANASYTADAGTFTRPATFFDSGHGGVEVVEQRSVVDYYSTVTLFATDAETRHRMAQMIHQARGKDRPVWVPELGGFLPVQSYTATSVTVEACADDPADHVGRWILLADGVYRQITGASAVGATHVLTIASHTSAPAEIAFLRLVRFDSDMIEIEHRSGTVSKCQIPVVEVV